MNENFIGIGERIKEKIKERNIKQIDVCKATGLSKNAMSNYISGNRIPDTLGIYKLAKFFSVSIEWLLTGEEPVSSPNEISSIEDTLLSKYRDLSNDNQLQVIGYIDALAASNQKEKSSISINGEEAATDETA